jgi:hypothetical protein
MFKAAKDTLTKLMKDPKILGVVETGMTAVKRQLKVPVSDNYNFL